MIKLFFLMGILSSLFGCKSNINPDDTITYFSLSEGGGMRLFDGYSYLVEETKDGKVHFLFNEGFPDEKEFTIDDHSVFDSLQQIVLKHKMYKYSGRYKPSVRIHDGKSWNFKVKYASGKDISANGYMAGPRGYREAFREIIGCLDRWKAMPAEVNGVEAFDYVYGSTRYHIEPQGDHALVTIDNEVSNRHEAVEKPLDMLEDLRVTAITESLRENGHNTCDDPARVPFEIGLVYANGDHYLYAGCDLEYGCHKTNVIRWFFERWEIEVPKPQN